MADFLQFVDMNSQPNGRHAGSRSAQFFFLPRFTRLDPQKRGEKNYELKSRSSVVAEFNRAQTELGRGTCGKTAAAEWLKKHRPKVALHPSMTDYCDTCKSIKEQLSRHQAIHNRLLQSGNATPSGLLELKQQKTNLEDDLRIHRENASKSRDHYREATKQCTQQWGKITEYMSKPHLTAAESKELHVLQHCFTLVISADYQQAKLIPYWGDTEQPGSTYYLQKVSNDIFGITDHRDNKGFVYLFDEHIGPKNTDHTLSFLTMYWNQVTAKHPWIKRITILLDNATSTNKNQYLFSWAIERVNSGKVNFIRFSFLIAGHTKFAPDRLFANIANSYKTADVFTIEELKALCDQLATTFIEDGTNVHLWRESLREKYSNLPGVRKLHDFLFIKVASGVVMKVREFCHGGVWEESPLLTRNPEQSGTPIDTYKDKCWHSISQDKKHT